MESHRLEVQLIFQSAHEIVPSCRCVISVYEETMAEVRVNKFCRFFGLRLKNSINNSYYRFKTSFRSHYSLSLALQSYLYGYLTKCLSFMANSSHLATCYEFFSFQSILVYCLDIMSCNMLSRVIIPVHSRTLTSLADFLSILFAQLFRKKSCPFSSFVTLTVWPMTS